jgi:hypothetical protein
MQCLQIIRHASLKKMSVIPPLLEGVLGFENYTNKDNVTKMIFDFWVEVRKRLALTSSQVSRSLILKEVSSYP